MKAISTEKNGNFEFIYRKLQYRYQVSFEITYLKVDQLLKWVKIKRRATSAKGKSSEDAKEEIAWKE